MSRLRRGPDVPQAPGPGYLENPTDADYARAARWALEQKNLPLAVQQVSAAISLRPLHEPYLQLLDRIVGKAKGPLLLVELPQGSVFFGLCAVRARVLARLGRVDEALRHLFEATAFAPEAPFLPWADAWIEPTKAARAVRPEAVAAGLVELTDAIRAREEHQGGARINLEAGLRVARRIRREHPLSVGLLVAEARVLRLLEREAEALASLGDGAGWEIAVERAAILRDLGRTEERARALEQAIAARPDEPSGHLDLGDAHLDDGRPEEAAAAYDHALALEASSDWARISAAYARALGRGPADLPELTASSPGPGLLARARSLGADLGAYESRLGDPIDPVIAVLRSVVARAPETAPDRPIVVRVHLDRPLAPSARVAFAQALARAGRAGRIVAEHPGGACLGPLWRATPDGAVPAVERPPAAVLERVARLAREPFRWASWLATAGELAAPGTDPRPIVDAMAHPPEVLPGADPVRWIHGFQVAAALLVARGSGPLDERRRALTALLDGRDDWSVAAALLGLRALGDGGRELIETLRALVPAADEPLPPSSRALAIVGAELTSGEARAEFLRLRARVRRELERGEPSAS